VGSHHFTEDHTSRDHPLSPYPDETTTKYSINGHATGSEKVGGTDSIYFWPIFEAYVRGYTLKIWAYMVQYLHFTKMAILGAHNIQSGWLHQELWY